MEVQLTDDLGTIGSLGPERVGQQVVRMGGEQQIWVNAVKGGPVVLLLREAGKPGAAVAVALKTHRLRSLAQEHDAAEVSRIGGLVIRAEVIGKRVELGMHERTVQALVVIQDDQLPVGLYV